MPHLCKCGCGEQVNSIHANYIKGHHNIGKHFNRGYKFEIGNKFGGKVKHGMSGTPTYTSWRHMKRRCLATNSNKWHLYGGRGIKVCNRWLDFINFLEDMGVRPEGTTLDRIDPNGDYEPGNVRWATSAEQAKNKRRG